MIQNLNKLFSTYFIQHLNYKNYHWHLKGQDFYSFHLMFDKHANIIFDSIDEIAERIRQLDGIVLTDLLSIKELSSIDQAPSIITSNLQANILEELILSHNLIIQLLNQIITISQQENDFATADQLTKYLEHQQQMLWFIKSSKE